MYFPLVKTFKFCFCIDEKYRVNSGCVSLHGNSGSKGTFTISSVYLALKKKMEVRSYMMRWHLCGNLLSNFTFSHFDLEEL